MTEPELFEEFPDIPEGEDSPEELIGRLLEERDQIIAERDQAKEQVLRTLAEMQNARKRQQDEMASLRKFASEQLVTSLLPVLDNFERTLGAAESGATLESLLEGVRLVDRQLREVLERVQLKKIESLGQPFNEEHHEAIGAEPSEEHPEGTVLLEVQPGYQMADKVIRHALVKVSSKP